MIQVFVFLLGSLGFGLLSRNAFTSQHSHGFPRFFAFEAILGLVVMNAPYWFVDPFSLTQVISWALLLDAAVLAAHSFWSLRTFGAVDHSIQAADQIGIEKTTRLVTEGPYRFIRHPLYASLLLLAWGAFLKQPSLLAALLAIIASLALFLTAVYEEGENLSKFGEAYAAYVQRTKRFIPFVF